MDNEPEYIPDRTELPSMTVEEFHEQVRSRDIDPDQYLTSVNKKTVAYLRGHFGLDIEKKDVYFDPAENAVAKYRKYADPPSQPQDVILFGSPPKIPSWAAGQQLVSVLAHEYVHVDQIERGLFHGSDLDLDDTAIAREVFADVVISYFETAMEGDDRQSFLEKTREHYQEKDKEHRSDSLRQEDIADALEYVLESYDALDGSPEERVSEILQHQETYYLRHTTDDNR